MGLATVDARRRYGRTVDAPAVCKAVADAHRHPRRHGPAGSAPGRPAGHHRLRGRASARGRSTGRWRSRDELARAAGPTATSPSRPATTTAPPTPTSSSSPRRGTRPRRPPSGRRRSCEGKVVISHGQRPRPGRQRVPAARAAAGLGGRPRAGGRARAAGSSAAFHHLPAKELGDLDEPIESDVLICSRRPDGHRGHVEIVAKIPGMPPARRRRAVATPRRSRRSPPCCCSSTSATRPGSRRSSPASTRVTGAATRARCRCGCTTPPARRSCRSSRARSCTMYTCGITPYDATHLGHAADVPRLRRAAAPAARPRPRHARACATSPTSTTRSSPRPASSASTTSTWPPAETARFDADMEALDVLPGWQRAPGHRRPSPTSAASSAWCSTGATPTRPAARCTSTSSTFAALRLRSATTTASEMLDLAARAGRQRRRPATSATRSTSCCGSRRPTTSRRGRRCGARAGPAGTSSARRWPCASSAPRSTCTAAAPT